MKDLEAPGRGRVYYLDNLRIVLIILVIQQHLTITFGGPGSWYIHYETHDVLSLTVFSLHNAVNQSFFMGFFFLLAGYFTPGSYDRKGRRRFILDRLLRLGIPLAIYDLLITPNISYLINTVLFAWDKGWLNFIELYYRKHLTIGTGPLWYVEKLLLFQLMYLLVRELAPSVSRLASKCSPPNLRVIGSFCLVMGGATFVMRLWLPFPENVSWLSLECPLFPPLYLSLFVVGILAYRGNWFSQISRRMGRIGWVTVFVLVLGIFPPLFYWGGAREGVFSVYMGGWHWQALIYAMWEPFVGMGIIIGLLVWFREKWNRGGKWLPAMATSTYTVYIIHGPVLVAVGLLMKDMVGHPLMKFVLAWAVCVPVCFLLGYLIRSLPGARKIL